MITSLYAEDSVESFRGVVHRLETFSFVYTRTMNKLYDVNALPKCNPEAPIPKRLPLQNPCCWNLKQGNST